MKQISVVVPVYFNEGSLKNLHQRLSECAAQQQNYQWEFVFVDDGSGDHSFEVLVALSQQDKRVKVIKLVRNFGSTMAIMAGLGQALGDVVAVISADLQDPPEIILEMLPHWEQGKRSVFAARAERDDPLSTRLPAETFNWLFRRFALKNYPEHGFDCFLIDRQVVQVVLECAEKNSHLPGLLTWAGFEYAVVTYHRQEREHGKSRWNLQRKLKYFADAFTAFSYFPLRMCSALGLLVALGGLLYALVVIGCSLFGIIKVEGWSSLMIVVLLSSGTQLIMLGVVGEYLWRNFDQTRHRPLYLIDRVVIAPAATSTSSDEAMPELVKQS